SLSSAGISSRHGTHQLAQILRSTTLPLKSASDLVAPSPSTSSIAGTSSGFALTRSAAIAPLLRPASGLEPAPSPGVAASPALSDGAAAMDPSVGPLSEGAKLTYTVANPAIAASNPPTRNMAGGAARFVSLRSLTSSRSPRLAQARQQ